MSKVITPEGRQTRIAYFPSGDPNEGRVKSITRVTDETAQTGPTTTFTYTINRDGGTGEVTDPIGTSTSTAGDRVTKTTYDRDRRPTKTLDALGRERREEYTSNFDTTAIFDAFNTSTTPSVRLNYDAQTNTLLGTVAQTGGTRGELTTSNAYGEDGRVAATTPGKAYLPTSEVNEQNHTTWNTYDARGNLTRVDRRSGANSFSSVQLEYDPASPGKLTGTRDGNNNLTSYAYTTRGDLQTITPPAPLGATTLRYDGTSGADDALGRVSSITDPEGRRQAFTYDALDRIVRIDFSQNGTNASSTTFTYDKDGNQTRRDDSAHGITTYSFDRLGRLTGDDVPGGDFTSYGYDLASNLTSLRDAGGTTTYGYDAVNRPKSVLEPGASSAIAYRYDEDASKNDTLMALPNGVTVEERLDKAGRLLETCARQTSAPTCTPSSAGRLFQQRYDWSQASTNGTKARAVRQSVTDEDGTTTMYRYDELDRLIGAQMTNSAGTVTRDWGYGYDGASNITSIRRYDNVSGDETTVTSTYNAANQLVSFGGSTFTYDSAGNETATTRIRTSSRYNARGQLDRVLNYGGTTITSAYAGPGQAERTQSSGVNITYNALGISATGTSDPRRYVRDPNGRLLSQRNSTSHQYLLLDGIGSVRAGLTTGGSVAWWRDFDPYGEPITNGHPSPTTSRFGFAGGLYDIQSGIYHFGQRFYDPETGRWTQPDPLNQPADLRQANRYAYVGGDPVNLVDPTGTVLWIPGTACYIYTAARDRDNSLRDEIWDLNQCYNPWAWF
jgi:RHS repeat-associated protein